jgi:hypothetical protein
MRRRGLVGMGGEEGRRGGDGRLLLTSRFFIAEKRFHAILYFFEKNNRMLGREQREKGYREKEGNELSEGKERVEGMETFKAFSMSAFHSEIICSSVF